MTRRQLLAAGLAQATVGRWLADGRLTCVYPGVYTFGLSSLSYAGQLIAALQHAGPLSGLGGATAAHWWSLIPFPPKRIHILSAGRAQSYPPVQIHRTRNLQLTTHRGLRTVPAAEAILHLAAAGASYSDLRRMLAEGEFRRILTPEAVEDVLGRGRPGAGALRRALESHQPLLARARSQLERDFIALLENARTTGSLGKLPMPEVNARIGRMTVDAVWREQRVVVELDGADGHRTAAQINRDRKRDLHLRALGYTVLRYSWWQLHNEADLVIADLTAALAARP